MSGDQKQSAALIAAQAADAKVAACIADGQSFLLEAGAGAGKTYSLIETLKALIASHGPKLRQRGQRIACITYTNAATAVINSRIDGSPVVFTDTIHAFCWALIKDFQNVLRQRVPTLARWAERLAESQTAVGSQRVEYELGYRRITDTTIFPYTDLYIKKQDDYIAFFVDRLEPACDAFARKRYGEMFDLLGSTAPRFESHEAKLNWSKSMAELIALRHTGTVRDVVAHIVARGYIRLPDQILKREKDADGYVPPEGESVPDPIELTRKLRDIAYREVIALDKFIDGHTPFATKHSVKGDEFHHAPSLAFHSGALERRYRDPPSVVW